MWVFASVGAWRATADEDGGTEFVAATLGERAAIMERVAMMAYYHAGSPDHRLDVGHTVPIGEGWVTGSRLDTVLVSVPYLWGPKLEHCQLQSFHVRVLWLVPITPDERAFMQRYGLDALERRFEESNFDYLDPFRASVVEDDEP